jgi:hypothetical protein
MAENHEGAIARLIDHLATPRSAVECFPALFKRPIGEAEFSLALVEAVAHLNYLLHRGLARRHLSPEEIWLWQRV